VAHVELGRVLGAELVDVRAVPHDALALSRVEVAGDFIDLRLHRQRKKDEEVRDILELVHTTHYDEDYTNYHHQQQT
jgi:hypothetical protein